MIVLTLTSDSAQTGTTSALVRLGADFAAVGRRTLLLDVLPRTDIAKHLGLPADAASAGPRAIGPNFIYAGLDSRSCSYESLAASEADVVVADVGPIGGVEAHAFLSQVPAAVVIGLRATAGLGAAYAAALGTFNGLVGNGARLKRAGMFVNRLNPNDFTVHQALESVATAAGSDLLVAPIAEQPGMPGPALVGTGLGELFRPLAEAVRERVLHEQRQATPVKVGLGDLATAFQQSGKQVAAQSAQDAFPVDEGANASQYTYVLDSQALADVVGVAAAPVVSHSASSAGYRPELVSVAEVSAEPEPNELFVDAPEESANGDAEVLPVELVPDDEVLPTVHRPRWRLFAAGGALVAAAAIAVALLGGDALSSGSEKSAKPTVDPSASLASPEPSPVTAKPISPPLPVETPKATDSEPPLVGTPEPTKEPLPKRKKRRRRRVKGEPKR